MNKFKIFLTVLMLCSVAQAERRTWTLKNGKTKQAEYLMVMSGNVVLNVKSGRQIKIPLTQLSQEDLDFIELVNPPKLKFKMHKKSRKIRFKFIPGLVGSHTIPEDSTFSMGVTVTKETNKPYPRELKIELFSIGNERNGKNLILFDRVSTNLVFSSENENKCTLWTKTVYLEKDVDFPSKENVGEDFYGKMIVVTDERGEIIASDVTKKSFLDLLENLRKLPVGKYFDEKGERTWPTRLPIPDPWGEWDYLYP